MNNNNKCPQCGAMVPANANFCHSCYHALGRNGQSGEQQPEPPTEKPSNHLGWAIFCMFCCGLLAIMALFYSIQVDSLWRKGDYTGAVEASRKVTTWCWISAIVAIIFTPIVLLLRHNDLFPY